MEECRKPSVGGEALLEGVMMRGPAKMAIAVRKADGMIVVESNAITPAANRNRFTRLPVVRGAVAMVDNMVVGVKAIMHSADFIELEDDKSADSSKPPKKMSEGMLIAAVAVALLFGIGLFMVIPYLVSRIPEWAAGGAEAAAPGLTPVMNLIEGAVRIILFVLYIYLISKMPDVSRVFQYHGAEHKSIWCYENGEELTVDNARKYTTRHPRCGTAFLFVVMIVSILIFTVITTDTVWINIALRLVLVPLIIGLSYEVIKFSGRSGSVLMKVVSAPGLWMQRFTTREPDDGQLEVALVALRNVVWPQERLDAEAAAKAAADAAASAEALASAPGEKASIAEAISPEAET